MCHFMGMNSDCQVSIHLIAFFPLSTQFFTMYKVHHFDFLCYSFDDWLYNKFDVPVFLIFKTNLKLG